MQKNMSDFLSALDLPQDERVNEIRSLSQDLRTHGAYSVIRDIEDVRTYMEYQVWCVWDFMVLLKAIQFQLTGNSIFWIPSDDATLGAYIYEVLLSEETDVDPRGSGHASHFETYLRAMREADAKTEAIDHFINSLSDGASFETALDNTLVPKAAKRFVSTTVRLAKAPLHVSVAVFCLSRENIIPSMFEPFLKNLPRTINIPTFRWYLRRHIELDSTSHGPLSVRLFKNIVNKSELTVNEALDGSLEALQERKHFLDAILVQIQVNQGANKH